MVLGLAGCGEPPRVTSYKVPKEPPRPNVDLSGIGINQPRPVQPAAPASETVDPATGPDRMLGAIIMRPAQLWFFKLTGAEGPVAAARQPFVDFLKAVEFDGEQGNPRWKLPDGWKSAPERNRRGSFGERFATLVFESQGAEMEIAVTSLVNPGGDTDTFLLMNLNRWLGQMSLPESTLETLRKDASLLEEVDLPGGNKAIVVNFRGKLKAGGMGPAPFAR